MIKQTKRKVIYYQGMAYLLIDLLSHTAVLQSRDQSRIVVNRSLITIKTEG